MYVDKECISQSIEHFRRCTYKKPEQIGLFFYFKAKGLNEFFYTKYEKWGEIENSERTQNLLNLYDLAAVFDYEKETGKKRCALFPFSISKEIKAPAFYNGATVFGGLGSRISDTLDNALVSTFIAKNTEKKNEIKLQNHYVELLRDDYLLGNKIPIELFAAWCLKFWNIDMPQDSTPRDFNDVCVLAFLDRYHISNKEFENMFYFGSSSIVGSTFKISGEELRALIKFGREAFPEVENEQFASLFLGERHINEEQVSWYLAQREGVALTLEDISRILKQRDSEIEGQYLESVNEGEETTIILESEEVIDKEALSRRLSIQYKNAKDRAIALNLFGIKYAPLFNSTQLSVGEILHMANIFTEDNEKEINRGIAIYEGLMTTNAGINVVTKSEKECLPKRNPRANRLNPLNIILYGAPGTGKTYSMVDYSLSIIENMTVEAFRKKNPDRKTNISRYKELVNAGQIVFTTFHQNYGYEEFIQGLRPDRDSKTISFKTVDGVFKNIADRALRDTEGKNFVIVIDEINRANISKVFGELITLIEEDKRWGELNETSATLQSGDVFAVPNNLYIIGTMNSADKSISLIDAALRRRFDFVEQKPESDLVPDGILRDVFESLNEILVNELESTDLLIGHSYFMGKTESELCGILNNNIIPLLYEYFYDDRKKVAMILNHAIEKTNAGIRIVDEKIGRLCVKGKVE